MTGPDRPRRRRWPVVLLLAAVLGCAERRPPLSTDTVPAPPPALRRLLDDTAGSRWLATGDDRWEVWICKVPAGTTAAVYGGLPLRLELTAPGIADTLNRHVTPYFAQLSHGAYRPSFVAGGEVDMGVDDEPQACLDAAIARSGPTARGVLGVADAEHGAGQPGGFGSAGAPCAAPPCPVSITRRAAYVGASDFHPDWGDRPPMDLVEHELGHALGWPHSGFVAGGDPAYQSALDVMSDSAAPRAVDPDRRDAADTLAVNRFTAGWLGLADVAVVDDLGATVHLEPSAGERGTRLAVVGLGPTALLTVEVLVAEGFDAHLPASGVAVHRVDLADPDRVAQPLVGSAPFTELLRPGDELVTDGWRITVVDEWTVEIVPSP